MLFFGIAFCLAITFLMYSLAYPIKYKSEVVSAAEKYDLSPALVLSIINVESGFDKNAVSKKGARGLMQLMPETAAAVSLKDGFDPNALFDVETNLDCGCKYLRYLLGLFSFDEAICAYNAGPTKVRSWLRTEKYSSDGITLKEIPFNETRDYLQKVKKNNAYYKSKV